MTTISNRHIDTNNNNNNNSMIDTKIENSEIPEEHLICKQLAHNELVNRTNGFALTKKYLQEKSKVGYPYDDETKLKIHDNLEKIWKGLFYMMWHSDKLTVQDKLAKDMSLLMREIDVENEEFTVMYFSAFLLTMSREWQGLDRYRVSKFLRLVRLMLREVFSLKNSSTITKIIQNLSQKLLLNTSQKFINSLKYHISEIWLEEWKVKTFNSELDDINLPKNQFRKEITVEDAKQFLEIWMDVVLFSDNNTLRNSVYQHVFDTILEESDATFKLIDENPALTAEQKSLYTEIPRLVFDYQFIIDGFMEKIKNSDAENQRLREEKQKPSAGSKKSKKWYKQKSIQDDKNENNNNNYPESKIIKHAARQTAYEYIERFKEAVAEKPSITKDTKDLSELDANAKLTRREKNKARRLKRKRKQTCDSLLEANFDTKTDFLSKRTKIREEKSLVMAEVFEDQLQKDSDSGIERENPEIDNEGEIEKENEAETETPAHPEYNPDISSNEDDDNDQAENSQAEKDLLRQLYSLDEDLEEDEEEIQKLEADVELENEDLNQELDEQILEEYEKQKKKWRAKQNKKRKKKMDSILASLGTDTSKRAKRAAKLDLIENNPNNDEIILLPKKKKNMLQKQLEMEQQFRHQQKMEKQQKKIMYADMRNSNKLNTTLEIESFMDSISDEDLKKKRTRLTFAEKKNLRSTKHFDCQKDKLKFKVKDVFSPERSPNKGILKKKKSLKK